ncbi:hypothetical protein EDD37DRAFT_620270 [Exophiala viscosa]|uniref:uncharacterized protein n=1 Tax=Exophiala viscosa TaxID=2486360 RepID=UPI00219B2EC2|nr:hypothetical protein EDD37DRAFT_620270 [Exophiala viscosa]
MLLPQAALPDSHRPILSRSRSHTDPSKPKITEPQTAGPTLQATRPPQLRSQSYLSPAETKPRNAHTLPVPSALERTAERLHRVHLPGSHHRHQHTRSHSHSRDSSYKRGHRPTQSEAVSSLRRPPSREQNAALPHLVAGLNAERDKHTRGQWGPAGTQSTDYTDGGRFDPRLRAVSDPHRPPPQPRPKTSFEQALERGDQARVARRIHVRREDIVRRDAEIAAAEEEMREHLADISSKGVEITRRLDYGYYNLLETVGNLMATITSFQSLSKQTGQLITNFDKETQRLDAETRKRVGGFKKGFAERERKAQALTERGRKASEKAEHLSVRLENARMIVENWERREDQVRKVWDRVFKIVWSTSISILVLVALVVLGKEWWFRGDPVKAGLRAHSEGSWNKSLRLGTSAGEHERVMLDENVHLPKDVKDLLQGIAERNRNRKVRFPEIPREIVDGCAEAEACVNGQNGGLAALDEREDPRLRRLDEL